MEGQRESLMWCWLGNESYKNLALLKTKKKKNMKIRRTKSKTKNKKTCSQYTLEITVLWNRCGYSLQGPVVRSLVSANRWLRGIKTHRFPWYLTLVSANHASSNPGQEYNSSSLDSFLTI